MSQPPIDTTAITPLLKRLREGDRTAENELASVILARFEALARRMLHKFPGVKRYEDTADLVQESMIRLLRSLREVSPTNTREFFGLAAEQIRRQLLDLLKRHRQALTRRRETVAEPATPADSDADLGAGRRSTRRSRGSRSRSVRSSCSATTTTGRRSRWPSCSR